MVSKNIKHIWGVQTCNTGRMYALTAHRRPFCVQSIIGCFDTFDEVSDLGNRDVHCLN